MYPTEPFVRSVIGQYEPNLCRMYERAWRAVNALPGRSTFDFKRTIAVLMHQFMMNEVRREFGASRKVRFLEDHETIRLLVDRKLAVRLKKMDKRGYARAIQTQAALAFTNEVPLALPFSEDDLPHVYAADVGYVLNDLETSIDSILVSGRYGESVIWSYEADRGVAAGLVATIAPVTPLSPSATRTGSVIKLPTNRQDRKDNGRD